MRICPSTKSSLTHLVVGEGEPPLSGGLVAQDLSISDPSSYNSRTSEEAPNPDLTLRALVEADLGSSGF
jgi:hypothetical protein